MESAHEKKMNHSKTLRIYFIAFAETIKPLFSSFQKESTCGKPSTRNHRLPWRKIKLRFLKSNLNQKEKMTG